MEGNMAEKDLKRSISSAQPKRRRFNLHLRPQVYETLFHLNRGFTVVLINLDRLQRLGIFRADYLRPCHTMTEEVRALTNTKLLAALEGQESRDAVKFQNIRLNREKRIKESAKNRR